MSRETDPVAGEDCSVTSRQEGLAGCVDIFKKLFYFIGVFLLIFFCFFLIYFIFDHVYICVSVHVNVGPCRD